ncbi:MAG: YitT family protein [Clostridiales bacterium]|nr:YitT family protein [Clostridiales bacterium]
MEAQALTICLTSYQEQGLRHLKRLVEEFRRTIRLLKGTNVLLVLVGSLIQAVGICNIHAFSDVTEGGALGLTLLIYHWMGISPAITSLLLNAGCYLLGWRMLGKSFLAYSAISVCFYSLCYSLLERFAPLWPGLITSPLWCALLGAVFVGVGAGLSVLGGGAPAADDALAMSLNKRFGWNIQNIYLVSDLLVLVVSLTYIPFRRIAYSLLTVILSGQIVGWIQRFEKK